MPTQPIVAESGGGGLNDLLDAFTKIAPMFGSGTTTSKTSADPEANGNANALLQQLQGGVDPNFLNDMQNQIFDKARASVAPELMNSLAMGNRAYSDTTLKDFASRATGYATAASAQAKLEAISKNNSLMTQIVDSQLKANQIKTTQTSASAGGKALQLGGAALSGYSLYKKLTEKKKTTPTPGTTSDVYDSVFSSTANPNAADVFGQEVGTGGTGTIGGATTALGNVEGGFDTLTADSGAKVALSALAGEDGVSALTKGLSIDTTATADGADALSKTLSAKDLEEAAGGVSSDFATENLLDLGGEANFGFDVGENLVNNFAADGATDAATSLAGDAALDFGFPYYTAVKVAGEALGINEITDITDGISSATSAVFDGIGDVAGGIAGGVGDALGSVGDALGDVFGGGSVICTELKRQEIISQRQWMKNYTYFRKHLTANQIIGYQFFGKMFVAKMQKSAKWTKLGQYILNSWLEEIKYKNNLFGKVLCYLVIPTLGVFGYMREVSYSGKLKEV